jgi:GrpB-like predicted nucleotidyltransferase (UPF0157 family)
MREEPVRIVPADPAWPARFEVERDALAAAIGRWAPGGIHHVGSTAVPGLDAKPVIDILVGVHDLASSRACFEPIARLGYVYAPRPVHPRRAGPDRGSGRHVLERLTRRGSQEGYPVSYPCATSCCHR